MLVLPPFLLPPPPPENATLVTILYCSRPLWQLTERTSDFRFPLGPITSRFNFSAEPYALLIFPSAKRTSPLVSMPSLPVPLSFEICSDVSEDSSSLPQTISSTFLHISVYSRRKTYSLETDGKRGLGCLISLCPCALSACSIPCFGDSAFLVCSSFFGSSLLASFFGSSFASEED